MNKGETSLRVRWLGINSYNKKKDTDHHQHLQEQQQHLQQHNPYQRPEDRPQQHWDLRPCRAEWEDQESTDSPPLLRSWQTTEEWFPPNQEPQQQIPHPPPPPPPPPPAKEILFPLTPRQQQQQVKSIHRSQRISDLAAMLTKENQESFSSFRMKNSRPKPINLFDSNNEYSSPIVGKNNSSNGDAHSPSAPRKIKKKLGVEQPRKVLQLAPMHSRQPPPPPQQQQEQQPANPTKTPNAPSAPKKATPSTSQPSKPPVTSSKFSYPAYWSDNEGRKLDIYQRSMLRLQEREKRLEERRKELAKENCTFAPKITAAGPTTPAAATNANAVTVTTPPTTTTVSTPTTTPTTSSSATTTTTTTTTAAAPAPAPAAKESVFERLYRQQSKQTARTPNAVPPKVTAAMANSWSTSTSRPGTDGNNSWVSSSMSSKIDHQDGIPRRNTRTTGTMSDSEAKLMRRRRLEEREMAECTFQPNLKWGKNQRAASAKVQAKTQPLQRQQPQPSPLSDGEGSKETITRRSLASTQSHHHPPTKRLPREIVTTDTPATNATKQTTERQMGDTGNQGRGVVSQPQVVSPLRDPPIPLQLRKVADAGKWAGRRIHAPREVSPLKDPPGTFEPIKGVESKLIETSNRPPVASPLRKPHKAIEHNRPAVASPLRKPWKTIEQTVVQTNKVAGTTTNLPKTANSLRNPPVPQARNKMGVTETKGRGNIHQPLVVSPLRGSPTRQDRQKSKPVVTCTTSKQVAVDSDEEDDSILLPVLPRRMAQASFRPVMDVPRVIYSESLATESVVSGRTIDTDYGSI